MGRQQPFSSFCNIWGLAYITDVWDMTGGLSPAKWGRVVPKSRWAVLAGASCEQRRLDGSCATIKCYQQIWKCVGGWAHQIGLA